MEDKTSNKTNQRFSSFKNMDPKKIYGGHQQLLKRPMVLTY